MLDTSPDRSQDPAGSGRSGSLLLLVGLAVVAIVVLGGIVYWATRDEAPAEADLDTAAASLDDSDADTDADGSTAAGPAGIEGQWTVDTSVGEFSFEDSTGTFVGFRVREELTGVGETEAVGRTPAVTGTVTIAGDTVTDAVIEADMTAITTNDSRRDNRVHSAIDSSQFPIASFALTSPIELGAGAASGEQVTATAAGDLTVHGVTHPVELDLEAQLLDDTIVVVGALDLAFDDFGVTVPSAPIVLSADNSGVIELQLFLAR